MELIANRVDYSKKIPENVKFIAKSGKEVEWFGSEAIKRLINELGIFDENVAVVINMGVNDLQIYKSDVSKKYIESFNMLTNVFPNVKFYILSVNPINEKIIKNYFAYNVRTNKNIEKMNESFENYVNNSKKENLKYCDSYNDLNFNTRDGLHYTVKTNEKIIEYILNDCLK